MDVPADLVTGIWVEVVASVGVGAIDCMGAVGLVVTGWASILTLYLLLASMVLFLLSFALGPGPF